MIRTPNLWIAAVLTAMLVSFAGGALAQKQNDPSTRKSPPAVWKNERNFNAVQKAWELVAEEQYDEAEAAFRKQVDRISDPYEKSQAMFGLAQAMMANDNFDDSLKLYEDIVNMDVLPNKPHFDAIFQIAQLYYMRERYDDSLAWIDRWQRESGEDKVEVYELRASIYAQKEQYRPALAAIDTAIGMSEKPKETWYQLKLAMHFELKEFAEAKDVLEILIRGWPGKKMYWTQLSSINVTLKQDEEALAVLALAHRKGLLDKQQDWIQLYSLYGFLNLPYKAAEILSTGIERGIVEETKSHWEQLGNAWYAAQELDNAVVALDKAAELSLDGKLDMQVAHILVDKEDWAAAKESLTSAIDKGGLTELQTGNMYVLLGMSELYTGSQSAARNAFMQARRYEKVRQAAQQWIQHLDELKKGS
ncbi:MAG: tetratricopeptide repeat protein [Xanthomonadales bacterium]|nr:tetratricopeptide repeat protein [Xanthomonadales bacterium]